MKLLKKSPNYYINYSKLRETDECVESRIPSGKKYVDVSMWRINEAKNEYGVIERSECYKYVQIYFEGGRKRSKDIILKALEDKMGSKKNPIVQKYTHTRAGDELESPITSTSYIRDVEIGDYVEPKEIDLIKIPTGK